MLKRFSNDQSGATAIEYGLIAALIVVVLLTAFTALGPEISKIFHQSPPAAIKSIK